MEHCFNDARIVAFFYVALVYLYEAVLLCLSKAPKSTKKRVLTHEWFLNIKQKKSQQIIIPENLDNNEDTKSDLHRSNQHGK